METDHDLALEAACQVRDKLVDRLLATNKYQGSIGEKLLARYLSGQPLSNPNGIETQLRHAQEDVLRLMGSGVEAWRT
jgi:hypothetical protein